MLDKVFKAYDVRGVHPDQINDQVAWRVGCATGQFLKSRLTGADAADPMLQHVVVGRDMRSSSPKLARTLIRGIRAAGANVIDLGMIDTSFIYFAINHLGCGGGIMVTASHNPPQYNGFKISGRRAEPIGADTGLRDIQRLAATFGDTSQRPVGRLEQRDLWADYERHVLRFLDMKRPLRVVVDASNGMAGKFVPAIFDDIKQLEIIPINFKVTDKFAHDPNPLVAENMLPTQEGVREHGADLGVCFDGDADRCMVVDEQGQIVGCDLLGAVMAPYFLQQSPGSPIVYDLRSTRSLPETITEAGGKPLVSRVGHVFMKKVMRDNNGIFGAELSGHMYYRDNFYTDSGAITFATVLTILSAQSKPMSKLIEPLARYRQSGEMNFKVEDKAAAIDEIRELYDGQAEFDELDGITVDAMAGKGWWFNVRASNTEPLLRLNLEARDERLFDEQLMNVVSLLGEPLKGH